MSKPLCANELLESVATNIALVNMAHLNNLIVSISNSGSRLADLLHVTGSV